MKKIDVLNKGFVRLVDSMGDDSAIVQAARVSYGKGTKTVSTDEALIRYLLRNKHTSPFEMVEFKFHCKMPIFIARQWIRHRTASVNEISGRYSEMSDDFYVPEENHVTLQNPDNKQGGTNQLVSWNDFDNSNKYRIKRDRDGIGDWKSEFGGEQESIYRQYEKYIETGMRKELARINLPLSTYTEWYWKIDLHNLLHFLRLRLDSHAQYEIRVYAEAIYEIIKEIVPTTCKAFEEYQLNSLTLTQHDIVALRKVFSTNSSFNLDSLEFPTKREKEEFLNKLTKLTVEG
jgi:thymidylate synthase (FAD)